MPAKKPRSYPQAKDTKAEESHEKEPTPKTPKPSASKSMRAARRKAGY
jgi:hypothetical protein